MYLARKITWYILTVLFISIWDTAGAQTCLRDRKFRLQIIKEFRLILKPEFSSLKLMSYTSDRNGCVSRCVTNTSCRSASFETPRGECSLFSVNSWENQFDIVSNLSFTLIQKIEEPLVRHEDWTLVFRAASSIGKSVYDAYNDTSLDYDQPLSPTYPIGCLRLDKDLPCDHHFRSRLVNNWSSLAITEVKFVIARDGNIEHFIVFNGSSSTFLDWFSLRNVLNSSWSDLRGSSACCFSIQGLDADDITRRFYVQYAQPLCTQDNGWFACIDEARDRCPWGNGTNSFPKFLYSPQNNKVLNTDMSRAEVMAIFIKY